MRKKEIIEKLTKENKENVSFVNNYDKIKDSLNIIEEPRYQKKPVNIFKYLTASLSVFVVFLTGLLIYSFSSKTQSPPNVDFPSEESLQNIYLQFENLKAKYIEVPIRNFIVDGTIVQLYFGVIDSDTIVLLLNDETNKLSHFLINDTNVIYNDGNVDESLDFEGDSSLVFDFYHYNTAVTLAKEDTYYIYLTISALKSEKIDVYSYIKYLEEE